jgi:hypothetical protein
MRDKLGKMLGSGREPDEMTDVEFQLQGGAGSHTSTYIMRKTPTLFLLAMTALVGCAGAEPQAAAPVRDTAAYMPADAIEMTFEGKPVEAPKPVVQPHARAADKPTVATRENRRGLFSLAKKN